MVQQCSIFFSVSFNYVHCDLNKSENNKRNGVEANSSSRLYWNVGKLLKVILKSTEESNACLDEGGCD